MMTSTVTSRDDDRQLLTLSGTELGTHALQSQTSCAVDYACILSESSRLQPNETSITDGVFSLLLELQNLADKLTAVNRRRSQHMADSHCAPPERTGDNP